MGTAGKLSYFTVFSRGDRDNHFWSCIEYFRVGGTAQAHAWAFLCLHPLGIEHCRSGRGCLPQRQTTPKIHDLLFSVEKIKETAPPRTSAGKGDFSVC